ncbi:GTPase IMAP family member 5 isoform X2 [Oreochromis niloticus]|uniref:GTPase IMAP family member 5 n=1 Tax=Oreochromis niloticus TaxID=8128 RepID=A0A669E691_ORENI|nr:GTPase IMAP family member 5 isoform X2 [Oreochromis niloticus]
MWTRMKYGRGVETLKNNRYSLTYFRTLSVESARTSRHSNKVTLSSIMATAAPVSELRIILLGSSWTEKSSVGNLLLGNNVFNNKPKGCVRTGGTLEDKKLVVINTPYLPPLDTSQNDLTEFIKDCAKHSAPGPHVFLLLVQPENFTEEHKLRLCRVLQGYSDRSFDHSLILISAPREDSSGCGEDFMKSPALNEMIKKCKCRYLKRSNVELPELLTHLGEITKDNNGEHVSYEAFEDTTQTIAGEQNPKQKDAKTPITDNVANRPKAHLLLISTLISVCLLLGLHPPHSTSALADVTRGVIPL